MIHNLDDNMSHGASRLRSPSPQNYKEDLELFERGVLDWQSLLSGYQFHNHPVEAILRGPDKEIKAIRRTHNLRTNVGGADQASVMSGALNPGKAQYVALASASITPNDQDQWLGGWGASTQAEETSASLARLAATYAMVTAPAGTGASTAQGTYKLAASWSNIQVIRTIYGCAVFGGASVGTPGSDLWFEAALSSSISVGVGDNLSLTYTINY